MRQKVIHDILRQSCCPNDSRKPRTFSVWASRCSNWPTIWNCRKMDTCGMCCVAAICQMNFLRVSIASGYVNITIYLPLVLPFSNSTIKRFPTNDQMDDGPEPIEPTGRRHAAGHTTNTTDIGPATTTQTVR